MTTGDWYRSFATTEAAGSSHIYERLALAVSGDEVLLELIDLLPVMKRQPNLLFAACRFLGAPMSDPSVFRTFLLDEWGAVSGIMSSRSTQTNEPARTGAFLPLLAQIEGPISLVEVGASAGLCLYPDRYRIRFGNHAPVGPSESPVKIDVEVMGPVPVPREAPNVVWRAGIDLHPLDVSDPDHLAWLSACIWPEHDERRQRLLAASEVVAADPPDLRVGDLVDGIDDLISAAPADTTPVVFHSAVLGYLDPARRRRFGERVRAHPHVLWLSNEAPGVVVDDVVAGPDSAIDVGVPLQFLVAVGGESVVARSDPHGRWLRWIDAGLTTAQAGR